jgi:hypothetical protein
MDVVDIIYYIVLAIAILYIIPLLVCIVMNEKYDYEVNLDSYTQVIVCFFSVIGMNIAMVYEWLVGLFKRR